MPDVLIEGDNPYRTRRASLLAEDGDLYLYLSALSGTDGDADSVDAPTMSAVWVANLGPAPAEFQPGGEYEIGRPPIMGRDGTVFPRGCPPPNGTPELVWFEEGDGVALVDADGILAVIPGWGGKARFSGYARHCRIQTPLAWPLWPEAVAALDQKVAAARAFWAWRLSDGWSEVESTGLAHLDARLGPREALWRVDGGSFPEMSASRHRLRGDAVWVTSTTGLSAQRMPQVDQFVSSPATRIELAVARRTDADQVRDAIVGPASIPFSRMTWLGEGHVVDGQSETNTSLGHDVAGVLLSANPPPDAALSIPDLSGLRRRGEAVTWLWVLAMDEATLALAKAKGSKAALDALASAGRSWIQ
ncbi:MAG: suppressor of fused domain protein [Actinomycetota bacterium]|nr:suppressor of fused domain protein [Actinomycetota bacterium]